MIRYRQHFFLNELVTRAINCIDKEEGPYRTKQWRQMGLSGETTTTTETNKTTTTMLMIEKKTNKDDDYQQQWLDESPNTAAPPLSPTCRLEEHGCSSPNRPPPYKTGRRGAIVPRRATTTTGHQPSSMEHQLSTISPSIGLAATMRG